MSTQWAQIRVGYPRLAEDTGLRVEERLRAVFEYLAETHMNYNGSARKSTNPEGQVPGFKFQVSSSDFGFGIWTFEFQPVSGCDLPALVSSSRFQESSGFWTLDSGF